MPDETETQGQRSESQILARIDSLSRDLGKSIHWWSSDWPVTFSAIEDAVDEYLRTRLQPLTCPKEMMERIKDRRSKLSLSSGITAPIVGICQQILAFGAAGIALTVGFIDKVETFSPIVQKFLAAFGIFYVELIVLSLLVLIQYMLQARFRYPSIYFEKIGNAWPYFYYSKITQVSRNPMQGSKTRFDASVAYARDLVNFSEMVLGESDAERLRAELQQYFLLMSYQAYVHQFAVLLGRLFMYGFIAAVATLLLMVGLIGGHVL